MEQVTYKIGEAASLLNLKTYVLRFWETEFSQITPLRSGKGQRLYTEKDILLLKRIQFLLHERGLTIEGVRKILLEESGGKKGKDNTPVPKNFFSQSNFSLDHTDSSFETRGFSLFDTSAADTRNNEKRDQEKKELVPINDQPTMTQMHDAAKGPMGPTTDELNFQTSLRLPAPLSEKTARQEIIQELEEVAKILQHRLKTGSSL